MKEITKKYMQVSNMFESAVSTMNMLLDGLVKMLRPEGDLTEKDKAELEHLRTVLTDELQPIMEKAGLALEKLVPDVVLEEAIAYYESAGAKQLAAIRPILQGYVQSLDEELGRRIEKRIAELAE